MGTKIELEIEVDADHVHNGRRGVVWFAVPGINRRFVVYEGSLYNLAYSNEEIIHATMEKFLSIFALVIQHANPAEARIVRSDEI
jgi:hypothetical protein